MSFGLTSSLTLGLLVGLYAGTHSRTAGVVAEHLLIALAVITITYVLGRRVGATVG